MSFELYSGGKSERGASGTLRTLLIFAALIALYLTRLGDAGLMEPDEARNAAISRAMVSSGDYVTPRLNGLKYNGNPSPSYMPVAASLRLFGVNNFAARFPSALMALVGIAAAWAAARRMYGKDAADWSAIVLGTSWLYFGVGRMCTHDMPFAALVTIAMATAWPVIADNKPSRARLALFFASLGLCAATGGLAFAALPVGALLCYALAARDSGSFWRFALWLPGYVIFAAITLPWFALTGMGNPLADAAGSALGDAWPLRLIIAVVAAGFVPWLGFMPGALRDAFTEAGRFTRRRGGQESAAMFLLCWCFFTFLFVVIFFFAAQSKQIFVLAAALPPAAILTGRAISRRTSVHGRAQGLTAATVLNALVLIALAAVLFTLNQTFRDPRYDLKLAWQTGRMAALALTLFAVLSLACLGKTRARWFSLAVPAAALLLLFTVQPAARVAASRLSAYELCVNLKEVIKPDDILINYRDFIRSPQFYLGKRIILADYAGELEYGKNAEPDLARGYFPTVSEFEKLAAAPSSGDKIIIFEDERGKDLPPFLARGAVVAATSQNFTAVRLKR